MRTLLRYLWLKLTLRPGVLPGDKLALLRSALQVYGAPRYDNYQVVPEKKWRQIINLYPGWRLSYRPGTQNCVTHSRYFQAFVLLVFGLQVAVVHGTVIDPAFDVPHTFNVVVTSDGKLLTVEPQVEGGARQEPLDRYTLQGSSWEL